jgi:hypothetical protein
LRREVVIIPPHDRDLLCERVIKSMNDHPFAVEVAIFTEIGRHERISSALRPRPPPPPHQDVLV